MEQAELERRVREHGVNAQLDRAAEILAGFADGDPASKDHIGRCGQAIAYARAALEHSDPMKLTAPMLDELLHPIASIVSHLEQYAIDSNQDQITNAFRQAEQTLALLARW